jgi:hypothetical protein
MNFESDSKRVGVVLYGGLGNQLFQYSAALTVAIHQKRELDFVLLGETRNSKTGFPEISSYPIDRSSFIHSNRAPRMMTRALVKLLLNISNSEITGYAGLLLRKTVSIFVETFLRLLTGRTYVYPTGLGWDPKLEFPPGDFVMLGNFHSHSWISPEARERMRSQLQLESNQKLDHFRELAISEQPTAIHIRLGDYLAIPELNVVDRDYFHQSIKYLQEKKQVKNFWIFTNDEEMFKNYLPSEISGNLRVIPQNLDACETLEVMRMCSNYIISNSTFSWWGAYLSQSPNPEVVAPAKWFNGHTEPRNICPNNWIRL